MDRSCAYVSFGYETTVYFSMEIAKKYEKSGFAEKGKDELVEAWVG